MEMRLILDTLRKPTVSGIPAGWIGFALGSVLIVICAAVGLLLKSSRDVETAKASTAASNIAAAITQDITRNVELYDLSLQGVLEGVADPEVMALPPRLRQLVLFDRAATAPFLGAIFVLDQGGDITIDSGSVPPRKFNYADREYFKAQAEHPNVGLFISGPLRSRSVGEMVIGLSRRVNKPDGSFGGVVLGTLRLEYIHRLLARMRLGARGSITLFRNDGTILMREPYNEGEIGRVLQPKPLFDGLKGASEGEYTAVSLYDGVTRLYHYQRVGNTSLVLNVGLSLHDIYADWWRKVIGICCVLAACCAIIVALAVALKKELRRRAAAEAALVVLAREDSLTGLANRRHFDEVLDAEWLLGLRSRTPLSLLMIDVDRFKAFNDRLGHPAGDGALSALGACFRDVVRRDGDLVARYGGEEFAVILPHTDACGAMNVAEALRRAVAALAIMHPGMDSGAVTVSIGIATLMPAPEIAVADLIAAADVCQSAENFDPISASNVDPSGTEMM
jgi:diguanylate cyclase (GGDEF)-like protein